MTPLFTGIIGVCFMLLLMAARMPIAIAMALPGFIGTTYLMGITPALTGLGTIPFSYSHSFTLTTVPMFILMGQLVFTAGISEDILRSFQKWLGPLLGGVAMATIGACAIFAAACGSSVASAAPRYSVRSIASSRARPRSRGALSSSCRSGSTMARSGSAMGLSPSYRVSSMVR